MLYREPKLLKDYYHLDAVRLPPVSVLYREPKLLKDGHGFPPLFLLSVSVLYREPKLLKGYIHQWIPNILESFSALP